MPASNLFTPLPIANGRIVLQHRIAMAPMTRNRGVSVPSQARTWMADDVVALYYSQRASSSGLVISEGIPPSLEAAGMPGVPGLFHETQLAGWKKVVDGVHAKGAVIYAQLWHAGRATIPQMTGCSVVSASSVVWETDETYPFRDPNTKEKIRYRDFPSMEMTKEQILQTTQDFVKAAAMAMEVGFDGVELNAGNGNLIDQYLHSNLNSRSDEYGGSVQARCKFPLDLLTAISSAIGQSNLAIRLEPACMYQGTYGMERIETWSHLCSQIADKFPELSYVHFIEPRQDRINAKPDVFLRGWTLPEVSNKPFRSILQRSGIPCISCGGRDALSAAGAIGDGWDGVAFARLFVSNPDLVDRLRSNRAELQPFDRSRFYGSWDGVREHGYIDYPTFETTLQ
ncbi:FMN-linked oxidoreductase [Amniculicola lignicola CBS 123094]|uniref:FMN-linked oxidoreductase n=1 Tax=Amniculicola lignicola CBS 123094 TaxID=1392246 RepID=A0A6A5WVP1_9PLEO|nr:FMN-linked oxidoreductase [Amniculicola lignicola CBS 123094]